MADVLYTHPGISGLAVASYRKLKDIRPGVVGSNLVATVAAMKTATTAVVGDETGTILLEFKPISGDKDYTSLAVVGHVIVIRNCIATVRDNRVILCVDQFGKIASYPDGVASTPPEPSRVDMLHDVSELSNHQPPVKSRSDSASVEGPPTTAVSDHTHGVPASLPMSRAAPSGIKTYASVTAGASR